MQVHVPTRGGIARFVVVSEGFCALGRMARGPQKSPHEPFFGIGIARFRENGVGALKKASTIEKHPLLPTCNVGFS